ncbi:hypothetical protein M413DRAFT_449462 [Hebeloma cylindrosporum]|uniref:Putative gamma-glutamylcyclotransferase n=1 Tax=Hebeloma cylindrosporum TaxID=76867 RepID=A0A0C2XDK1_HEBCY|nr:hypothetical protein M413DRAFT_449462 [Hebeloma cylindrosporum h7]
MNLIQAEYTTDDSTLRPLFLYGTLRALPLLAWALTGDHRKHDQIIPLTEAATLPGFSRLSIIGKDYPALVREPSSTTDGLLFRPQTRSQRRKLDDFEGESYEVTPVTVIVEKHGMQERVDADVYLWNGDAELSSLPWDLEVFKRDRLEDWLDIFSGMELVGGDEEQPGSEP